MKKFLFLVLLTVIVACTDNELITPDEVYSSKSRADEFADSATRLNFSSEDELLYFISNGSQNEIQTYADKKPIIDTNSQFISLVSEMPNDGKAEKITYYEHLGYDSLVPNMDFAKLLNIRGEIEVGENIIKITQHGTFIYPIDKEDEFIEFFDTNKEFIGDEIEENTYQLTDNITLIRSFRERDEDYTLISEGDYEELPDSYFGDDNELLKTLSRSSVPEPDFNSFKTFSADRQTLVGKIIQNIIGSTKASTINFSKKRRVRGSFYFYNYGVYGEIGVQGWTDKKNWIGWSKTASDELRVGWRHVLLKKSLPDFYKTAMKDVKDYAYMSPQNVSINGKNIKSALLIMPQLPDDLKNKIITQGVKAVYDFLKTKFGNQASSLTKGEACVIATPSDLHIIVNDDDKIRYGTKSYTHVFSKNFMEFTIGWSNTNGFFIGNVTQNNANQIKPWIQTIIEVMNQKKTTLIGGEVYVCARFGDNWRGMKIIKK
ncbi:MAG: hypothetical protein NC127_05545 [Muribaculum sp.]|nr:hypothetical protein [Muribaculum sp.]